MHTLTSQTKEQNLLISRLRVQSATMPPTTRRNGKKRPCENDVVDLSVLEDDEDYRKPAVVPSIEASVESQAHATLWSSIDDDEIKEPPRKRAARKQPEAEFSCAICFAEASEMDDVKNQTYSLVACGHAFCFVCLEQLVQTSTAKDSISSKPIPCPMAPKECSQCLTIGDIQSILMYSPKTYQQYTEASTMAFVEDQVAQGNARRCPNEHCNFTFEYEPTETPPAATAATTRGKKKAAKAASKSKKKKKDAKLYPEGCLFHCPLCKKKYCLDCGANEGKVGPPHKGTCQQRFEELTMTPAERKHLEAWRKINEGADEQFRKLLKREAKNGRTKMCPKCHRLITKNGGCDHMYCSKCKRRFNWSQAPRFQE